MHQPSSQGAWRVLGERTIYESQWVTLGKAEVILPSGQHFEHHTVTMPEAAMAVVLDDAREHVLLSWRHRFVPDVWNYELPGGLLDTGESPEQTIAREIVEETGYRARSLRFAVAFEPMVGMLRSRHHVFIAEGVERVGDPVELDEGTFQWVPLADVPSLIASGKVINSGTVVGLLHYLALTPREDRE
ncbi:NUDIX hydrolase [Intrasporangium chromatireducens Q5-1]|uniref:NUDIX hydrolase n=1 Tax=Intrasporangium chromatireducens Q5-1 TaxID=584657 RepID=W9GKL1_9MICO|nr:NUDIX hydrolase [Intrasporangium chromatireducens]EWT05363.1 NUDIX hydrolase [Intrasporangium chromatireducens Q5-1]